MAAITKRGVGRNPYRRGQGERSSKEQNSMVILGVVIVLLLMVVSLVSSGVDRNHTTAEKLPGVPPKLRASSHDETQQVPTTLPLDKPIEMKKEHMDKKPTKQEEVKLQQELVRPEVSGHRNTEGIHFQAMEDYHFNDVKFFHHYAKGKPGVVIEDMLMAHAYSFHMNGTYGGCCVRAGTATNVERHQELLDALGLKDALPFACPKDFHDDHVRKSMIPKEKYHAEDTRIWTPAYVAYLKSLVHYPPKNEDEFVIVAHVRRGEVTPCRPKNKGYERYLPNQHFLNLIDQYIKPGARVEIITQSDSFEPLDEFYERGYTVHVDENLASFWRTFILADVVILSRSDFSMIPAVCATGRVVYTPFWHPAIRGWDHVPTKIMEQTGLELEHLRKERCLPG